MVEATKHVCRSLYTQSWILHKWNWYWGKNYIIASLNSFLPPISLGVMQYRVLPHTAGHHFSVLTSQSHQASLPRFDQLSPRCPYSDEAFTARNGHCLHKNKIREQSLSPDWTHPARRRKPLQQGVGSGLDFLAAAALCGPHPFSRALHSALALTNSRITGSLGQNPFFFSFSNFSSIEI